MHGQRNIKIGSSKFNYYYLHYVPASKPFDSIWIEVLEAIMVYYTWSENR